MIVTIQNVSIFYKEIGNGEPVLFLHGVPDTSDIWDAVIQQLKPNYRCIAPDWPGFGRSGAGESLDCSLDGHADFVNSLADSFELNKPFRLVTHDFGGISAIAFVSKYPQRVSQLVILNAPFSPDYRWHIWAKIWRTPLLGELSMILMNRWIHAFSIKIGSRKLGPEHICSAYSFVNNNMKRMVLKMYRAMPEKSWKGWDARLVEATAKIPTLILWGQKDFYMPNWLPERYGAKKIVRFNDCGHWVPAEEPELVSKELLSFLGDN